MLAYDKNDPTIFYFVLNDDSIRRSFRSQKYLNLGNLEI